MWTYNHADELVHYGVKGMKWGVRRYQNKDGSLTAKGRKRLVDAQKSWEKDVSENWHTAYNSAARKHNREVDAYNAKWKGVDVRVRNSENRKKYLKEFCERFNEIYVTELKARFGDSPMTEAKTFVKDFMSDPAYREVSWQKIAPMMYSDDDPYDW